MREQRIICASDDYQELKEYFREAGVTKIFLVCGNSARKLLIGKFFDRQEFQIDIVRFSGFHPNPLYEEAAAATTLFRKTNCDAIVAVGGGSAIDVAKCVKLWACMDPTRNFLEQTPISSDIPFLAVPTTAGTGSEATRYAVIYAQGKKQSITHESCVPTAVFFDPSALETLPDYHRKSSMMDALCHGIESFWSVHADIESRKFSKLAIQKVLEYSDGYLTNIPTANAGMLEAANLAGKAIDRTQTTAGHAMCYNLTSLYGIAHGHAAALCVSKLWPFMVERAVGTELEVVFQELATAMGCKNIVEAIQIYDDLLMRLNLELPVPKPEDFEYLRNSVNPVRLKNNPFPLDLETIDQLYHQILSKSSGMKSRGN